MSSSHSNANKEDLEKGITAQHVDQANAGPIQLTREQYGRLFLEPGGMDPTGDSSQRFGNPTPLAVVSFLLALAPTACCLMGWGSADATSLVSIIGTFYFVGGLGMVIGGVMEWILGNTFSFVAFVSFGGFWLSLATTNDPMHAITSAYSGGANSPAYNSGLMFYFAFWTVVVFIYLIASLRTNLVFAFIFFALTFAFALLSAAYGQLASGNIVVALRLLKAAGAFAFATVCAGFYLELALIVACVKMPFRIPLGDLSGFLSEKKAKSQ
ncbi:hypothetical protein L218DRAFT_971644 [Marasmius fiardii PR-910]|nr:hypothetical protein L218DRAFT_971644 [Marasmius fiardii PR-910]